MPNLIGNKLRKLYVCQMKCHSGMSRPENCFGALMQVKNCTFVSSGTYANQLPTTPFDTALPAVEPTQDVFTAFSP